ncbi:hypothetical protein [Streptomyces sp. CBMA29]|nr:hypothetical protein [Streptomyces sp. CBMA29]
MRTPRRGRTAAGGQPEGSIIAYVVVTRTPMLAAALDRRPGTSADTV